MASQISGNIGAANVNAVISAFKLDGRVSNGTIGAVAPGAPTSLFTQAVVSGTGAFTLGGLVAGTYLLTGTLTNNPPGRPGQTPVEPSIQFGSFTVDGSTSYNI